MSEFHFTRRAKGVRAQTPPFSVGRHAMVHHEKARTHGQDTVLLTDESGTETLRKLADGQEVEMLAWRLAWRQGPRMLYRVSCLNDGKVGWVRAEFLRTMASAAQSHSAVQPTGTRAAAGVRPRGRPSRGPTEATSVSAGGSERASVAVDSARDSRPVACSVCGREVHPYNLWKDARGRTTGCYLCHGRRVASTSKGGTA